MIPQHEDANVQKQIRVTELNTSRELLQLIFCISQGSVVTHLRCGGKYDTSIAANLLLIPTVKTFFLNRPTFLKVMNEYRMARFLWPTMYLVMPSSWSFMPSTQSFMPSIQSFMPSVQSNMPSTKSFMPSIQSFMPSIQSLCGEPGASHSSNPWTDLAILGLNNVSWPNDALLGMLMATHNFKGFKPPKRRHFPATLAKS